MTPEEQLLLQQQQKLEGIEQQQRYNLFRSPGQVQGANSQAQGYGANPAPVSQPVTTPKPVVQQTPAKNTQGTVQNKPAITNMDELAQAMGYTSPEQEEKLRKASVANQRILALGDALRHIGNIATTINYAPSQQFNQPWAEEQQRYEKGKAVRDAANAHYLSYQQAKAAQDAKQKQWEMDFQLKLGDAARKAGYTEAQIQNMKDRLAQQKAYQDANIALGQRRADDAKAANEARIKEQNRHNRVSEGQRSQSLKMQRERTTAYVNRAKSSGGSSGVAPLDTPKGQITPNGRSYSNQLLQMFDYAKSKGYVKESDVAKRLREMGFGKDQSDNVKRQMVMDLLRTNQEMGDYAANRLGWSYGGGAPASDWDQYAEEEDDWSQYED